MSLSEASLPFLNTTDAGLGIYTDGGIFGSIINFLNKEGLELYRRTNYNYR